MVLSSKISIVLVGCGDWGKNIAKTLSRLNVLKGIVDPHPTDRVRALVKDLGVSLLEFDQCLEDSSVSGMVMATPTPTHFELASRALTAGKHVLVEKPLAPETNQVQSLIKLAEQQNRVLMVGHLLLYHPAFQKIVDWVESGKLGKILEIQTYRRNLGKIHLHESVTWDLGPHDLSMVFALTKGKSLKKVSSEGHAYVSPHNDISALFLEFEEGPFVQINLSRLHPFKEQKLIVIGTQGMAVFDDTKAWDQKAVFYKSFATLEKGKILLHKDDVGDAASLSPAEPLKLELEHFIQCIEKNQTPLTSGESALEGISILNKIEKFKEA
jgi:predicted dehydrogenase